VFSENHALNHHNLITKERKSFPKIPPIISSIVQQRKNGVVQQIRASLFIDKTARKKIEERRVSENH